MLTGSSRCGRSYASCRRRALRSHSLRSATERAPVPRRYATNCSASWVMTVRSVMAGLLVHEPADAHAAGVDVEDFVRLGGAALPVHAALGDACWQAERCQLQVTANGRAERGADDLRALGLQFVRELGHLV